MISLPERLLPLERDLKRCASAFSYADLQALKHGQCLKVARSIRRRQGRVLWLVSPVFALVLIYETWRLVADLPTANRAQVWLAVVPIVLWSLLFLIQFHNHRLALALAQRLEDLGDVGDAA